MKNTFFLFLFLAAFHLNGLAQQTLLNSFYQYNWSQINPAAVDKIQMFDEHQTIINATARQQWIGLKGSPLYYHLAFENMPEINNQYTHRIKWGFSVFKDQTDQIQTLGITINFAYYIQFSKNKFLHFGISPSLIRYQVNIDEIKFKEEDPLSNVITDQGYTDMNFGVFYRQIDKESKTGFYLGLSVPQAFALRFEKKEDSGFFAKERVQHINLLAGGFIKKNYRTVFAYEPSMLVRYVPGLTYNTLINRLPISADFNLRAYYLYDKGTSNSYWGGLGYSTNRNLRVEIGLDKNGLFGGDFQDESKVRVAFSWEIPIINSGLNLGQSLELNIAYAWDLYAD